MDDVNDISKDVSNGFVCGAWRTIREYDGVFVMRCDRPDGHKGYHVDKVLLTNWDGPTPQETQKREREAGI